MILTTSVRRKSPDTRTQSHVTFGVSSPKFFSSDRGSVILIRPPTGFYFEPTWWLDEFFHVTCRMYECATRCAVQPCLLRRRICFKTILTSGCSVLVTFGRDDVIGDVCNMFNDERRLCANSALYKCTLKRCFYRQNKRFNRGATECCVDPVGSSSFTNRALIYKRCCADRRLLYLTSCSAHPHVNLEDPEGSQTSSASAI